MSAQIEDGGPAFPCHTNPLPGRLANARQGMTLLDWFAGQAIMPATIIENKSPTFGNGKEPTYKGIATRAYILADAMIEARKGGE